MKWARMSLCTEVFRRSTSLLATCILTLVAAAAFAQSASYLDESEKGRVWLDQVREHLEAERHEEAARLAVELLEIGEDVVLPDSGHGVRLAVREVLSSLPEPASRLYLARVQAEAQAALEAARRTGKPDPLLAVARNYPATAESRAAVEQACAVLFEQGHFARVVEQSRLLITDGLPDAARSRRAALIMGLAAIQINDARALDEALSRLKSLPGGPIEFLGRSVDASRELEQLRRRAAPPSDDWTTLGGGADRTASVRDRPSFAASLRLWAVPPAAEPAAASDAQREEPKEKPTSAAHAASPAEDSPEWVGKEQLLREGWFHEAPAADTHVLATAASCLVQSGADLVVYDRSSGIERWRLRRSSLKAGRPPEGSPSCAEGFVAATIADEMPTFSDRALIARFGWAKTYSAVRTLCVLREEDGALVWQWKALTPPGGETGKAPAEAEVEMVPAGSPLIYGGRVFVGAARGAWANYPVDSYLLCFDLQSGELLWRRFIGSGVMTINQKADYACSLDRMVPATDGRCIYVESAAGPCAAVDLASTCVVWAKCFDRPKPAGRGAFLTSSDWPPTIVDAPCVVGESVVFSDIYGPKLRCLRSEDGSTVWKTDIGPGWRLGIHRAIVLFASESQLKGYDVATGEERLSVDLPSTVTGRGFVAGDAVYLPTSAGIAEVNLESGAVATVVEVDRLAGRPTGVVAQGGAAICADEGGLCLLGDAALLSRQIERSPAEGPGRRFRSLHLAELARQSGDFARAETHLRAAADAGRVSEDGRLGPVFDRQLTFLATATYRHWADRLMAEGQSDQALGKLGEALRWAPAREDKQAVMLLLASCYDALGRRQEALDHYSAVANDAAAKVRAVATTTGQLRRTVAAEASLALLRLREQTGEPIEPPGLKRDQLKDLVIRRVAKLSWSGASYAVSDVHDGFGPVVWARPAGLAVFSPVGDLRWACDRAADPSQGPPMVQTWCRPADAAATAAVGPSAYEYDGACIAVYDLRRGDPRWTWRPEGAKLTPKVPSIWNFKRLDATDRARTAGKYALFDEQLDVFGIWPMPFCVADSAVVAVTMTDAKSLIRLHGLDLGDGSPLWQSEFASWGRFRGLACSGNRAVALVTRGNTHLVIRALDVRTGEVIWNIEDDVAINRRLRCLAGADVFVYADSTGKSNAIDMASGEALWPKGLADKSLAGSAPVLETPEAVIFHAEQGYVAVAKATARTLWRFRIDRDDSRAPSPVPCGSLLIAWVDRAVIALDAGRGRAVWRHDLKKDADSGCGFTVSGDVVVAYGRKPEKPQLVFLAAESGKSLASLDLPGEPEFLDVSLIPGGLFVRCGDDLYTVVPASAVPSVPATEEQEGAGAPPSEPQ